MFSAHSSKYRNRHHQHPGSCEQRNTAYMLLCFPGELTHRFLFWLREPPMATAEMLLRIYSGCFVTETLFALTSFTFASPSHSYCAVAHHTSHTCHHWNTQPLLCALMLQNPKARRYKCSHVNGSARAPPLRSSLSLSLYAHTQLEIKQAVPSKEECVGVENMCHHVMGVSGKGEGIVQM